MASREAGNGGVLIVAGHAIYQKNKWHGGFPGEDRYYEGHVLDGLQIARSHGYGAICFSGGRTRDHAKGFPRDLVTNSEAQGMMEFARDTGGLGAAPPRFLVESFARDSFENVLFSMLCFYSNFGEWPSRVGIVSWKFKAVRFYLIACGLKLGDGKFVFYGSGDPHLLETTEIVAASNAQYDAALIRVLDGKPQIFDPLHRDHAEFGSKRLGRLPFDYTMDERGNEHYLNRLKEEYGPDASALHSQDVVAGVIEIVENLEPGLEWRDKNWPWT